MIIKSFEIKKIELKKYPFILLYGKNEGYKSQIKNAYHPRSKEWIINLAKYRGQFINSKYAEAFKIIKAVY